MNKQPFDTDSHLKPEQCALIAATAMRDGNQPQLLEHIRQIGRDACGDNEFDNLTTEAVEHLFDQTAPTMARLVRKMFKYQEENSTVLPTKYEDTRKLVKALGGRPCGVWGQGEVVQILYKFLDDSIVAVDLVYNSFYEVIEGGMITDMIPEEAKIG